MCKSVGKGLKMIEGIWKCYRNWEELLAMTKPLNIEL